MFCVVSGKCSLKLAGQQCYSVLSHEIAPNTLQTESFKQAQANRGMQ